MVAQVDTNGPSQALLSKLNVACITSKRSRFGDIGFMRDFKH